MAYEELINQIEKEENSAYILSPDLRILSVNAGYRRFARENGGADGFERWSVQPMLTAVTPEPLRKFYEAAFARARATGIPWDCEYECSSPERYRRFHMVCYPVSEQGFVVIHSLRIEAPHPGAAHEPDADAYVSDGFIRMCSHCRRVRNVQVQGRWDWVPSYLRPVSDRVSHGLCQPCAAFHWGVL